MIFRIYKLECNKIFDGEGLKVKLAVSEKHIINFLALVIGVMDQTEDIFETIFDKYLKNVCTKKFYLNRCIELQGSEMLNEIEVPGPPTTLALFGKDGGKQIFIPYFFYHFWGP